jgi:predicted DNA-binding transcriptional regulator AlpA
MILVPLTEIIRLYGGSESWWRKRIAEGLPARRWGRRLRFSPSEVEEWLDARYATLPRSDLGGADAA